MIQETLEKFGLTEKEVKVYLASLKLQSSSVQEIAREANTYRAYTYEVLRSLQKKGLVFYTIQSGKKNFKAAHPKKLLENLKERENEIKKVMPELEGVYKSTIKKPNVKIYDKKEGIKTIIQRLIQTAKKEYVGIGNHKYFEDYFKFYSKIFVKRRIEQNIKSRLILEISKKSNELVLKNKEELRKTKLISKLKNIKAELWAYNDKIVFFTLIKNEPIGIEIENQEIAHLVKTIFEILWSKR